MENNSETEKNIYGGCGIGMIGNITNNTNNTNNTDITNNTINSRRENTLGIRDRILFAIDNNPMNIASIAQHTNTDANSIQNHIHRAGRNSGLLDQELIKIAKVENGIKFYTITFKGQEVITNVLKMWEKEDEEELLRSSYLTTCLEQVEFFENYFDYYNTTLNPGKESLTINYSQLSETNIEAAEQLVMNPERTLEAAKIALKNKTDKQTTIRITNLPPSCYTPVSGIRSEHIGRLIKTKGKIIIFSKVLPRVTSCRFECPSCGNIIPVLQLDEKLKEPTMCATCGRKGQFRLIHKELTDAQKLVLEESVNDLGLRSRMVELHVIITGDTTSIGLQHHFEGAEEITINGIVRDADVLLKTGGRSVHRELFLDANNIEVVADDDDELSESLEAEIRAEVLKKDFAAKASKSYAPHIIGWEREKFGILLGIVSGGSPKTQTRDDSHVCLVGDPGTAKSELVGWVRRVFPMARMTSGETSSGPGLTAAFDKKDDFFGGAIIRKGALPLAHGGGIVIDELDKFPREQLKYLHSALEQQEFSFNKGGLHQRFLTDCFAICAANPRGGGRFDRSKEFASQVSFPPTILSRFDLIFPFPDDQNFDDDLALGLKVLKTTETSDEYYSEAFLKGLVKLARRINPSITKEVSVMIARSYAALRQASKDSPLHITPRMLYAITRLSKAHAKIHLQTAVTVVDVEAAMSLLEYSLGRLHVLNIDASVLEEGVSKSFTARLAAFRTAYFHAVKDYGAVVPLPALQAGVNFDLDESFLATGRQKGLWSEPRKGFFKLEGGVSS